MFVVKVSGGIGNQLFQYAFGRYLEITNGSPVFFDLGNYNYTDNRCFRLGEIIPDIKLFKSGPLFFSKHQGVLGAIGSALFHLNLANKLIREADYTTPPNNAQGIVYLEGYWQSKRYAEVVKKELWNVCLDLPSELLHIKNEIRKTSAVSLHVRRGDFFSPTFIQTFGVCDANYYQRAIEFIQSKVRESRFFVFSDDLNWVNENLTLPNNTIYVPNIDVNDYSYISLMSTCKHNIISNSSFSWWGAYLNYNPEKIVVAPSRWILKREETIALESWFKI